MPCLGEARHWALDLVGDCALWRAGTLDWLDVPNRALLLSGPPGTGKSTFPKLLARSLGVPLIETSVAEWNAHRNLSGTLEQMRSVFASIPQGGGVLFIDELDGIGRRDQPDLHYRSYWDQIVNQLLTLVGQAMRSPGVVIIGATNYPDRIDPALLRSGRIERHIRLNLPDGTARSGIIRHYAKVDLTELEVKQLAEMTEGCSGADLERLVRNASATARRYGFALTFSTMLEEVRRPMRELDPRDRLRISVYSLGQALVAELLNATPGETPLYSTIDQLRDRLTILMGGRASEEIMIGEASNLGEEDLASARAIGEAIETRWALGSTGLGLARVPDQRELAVAQHVEDGLARAIGLLSGHLEELKRRCSGDLKMVAGGRSALASTLH